MMWEVRKAGEVMTGRKVPWVPIGQLNMTLSAGDSPVEVEIEDNLGRKRVLEGKEKGDFRLYEAKDIRGSGVIAVNVRWSGGDCSSGHFLMRPEWLDALSLVTVVPRSLGTFANWRNSLQELCSLGYSMVHFAPIQAQNQYKSHYCLSNHLELNPDFFPGAPEARRTALNTLLSSLRATAALKFMQDIVLNHASTSCPLFQSSSESAYTPSNSPYLACALEVDLALKALGMEVAEGRAEWYQYRQEVSSTEQVEAVMRRIQDWLLPALRLEEYFQLDEARERIRFEKETQGFGLEIDWNEARKYVQSKGTARFGCYVSGKTD